MRNGSMPISTSLVSAPAESFVCRVLSTRCPVSDARIAMSAVSLSRISPTIIMSGSWRRTERRTDENVSPISGFTCV